MSRFPNHGWRSVVRADSDHVVYRRPLANTELGFYWDSVFSGTAVTINHIKLSAEKEFEHALFSELNVQRAWIRMKRRFPLLGASVEELPGSDAVEFVVDEASLRTHRAGEVHQMEVENEQNIDCLVEHLHNGPSPVSNEILSKIWIVRQKDVPYRYHLVVCAMHFITDGVANATTAREFMQELSALSDREDVDGLPLPERLATLLPIEDLSPLPHISPARRRWRDVTGKVILNIRQAKLTGGQSLPTVPQADLGKPAYSRTTALHLPEGVSERIIRSCRALGITFGSALPVFSQLAVSRVLHRRRFRVDKNGKPLIDDEEWEYRRRQPMHFGGPVNFRPYLNRKWYESGGDSEVCLAITFSFSVLPFMPAQDVKPSVALDGNEIRSDNVPPFSALFSPERFLYRALLANAQTKAQLKHPLFFEIHNARTPRRVSLGKAAGLAWRAKQGETGGAEDQIPSTYNQSPCVLTNNGASLGNRDSMFPYDYPYAITSDSKSKPKLHIVDTVMHLRCRPSELYLGAIMQRKQLIFFNYADLNVYDESVVREWLGEVRDAAIHYLGGETPTISRL